MKEESNGEQALLDTSLKQFNEKISALVHRKLRILTNTYTTALTTKQDVTKVLFPPCLIENIPLSNKDDLIKENARTKQMLKKNGYQESIVSKIFKRINSNHSLCQSQQ